MSPGFEALDEVAARLARFERPWLVAGGWAIDLHLGRVTREHSDVEIAIYREDQFYLRASLEGWEWTKLVPRTHGGGETPWLAGDWLKLPVHQVHARKQDDPRVGLDFLINESRGDLWVFRRDPEITRARSLVECRSDSGIPHVAPEVQLLFKAKERRCKDEQDLQAVVGELADEPRAWLRAALERVEPGHPWLRRLA